jgi:hypothetical protein
MAIMEGFKVFVIPFVVLLFDSSDLKTIALLMSPMRLMLASDCADVQL